MAVLCSNCAGKLIFNPASQKLECANCGAGFRPEDVSDINADIHSKYYDTRVYTCSHCGAEVVTSDTESSTFCVYCGNPAIVFSRVSKEYRPDGIIPFKITKQQALDKIKSKFVNNPIVPKEIAGSFKPENMRGIYVPYWVINADYQEADWISGTVKRGKSSETRYYSRSGEVKFKNVPIDGSRILNDDVSLRLEPFYLEDSKEFDEDYLNGFYSNTSDMDFMDLRESASKRCHKLYAEEVVKSIPRNVNSVRIRDSIYWADIQDDPIYMMFPVWFLTFKYNGKPYTVLVNGQTGKVTGTLPWLKKRVWGIAIATFILVIAFIIGMFFVINSGAAAIVTFMWTCGVSALLCTSVVSFTVGFRGLRRILKNLRLAQSEAIFNYVKRRQS
jgi:DNA-directed RNA polymerase subunit RPC12/RpoP